LAVVRDLGRGGFEPVGADFRAAPLGLHSRWSPPYVRLPPPGDVASLLSALRSLQVDALLPLESGLVGILSRRRDELSASVGLAVPRLPAFLAAYDNLRTTQECHRLGIPAPRVLERHEVTDTVVVKPREDVGAGQGVTYCRGPASLDAAIATCRASGEPFLQEYVPGGVEAMRTVVVLFDRRSRLVARFTTRKLCQIPPTGGMTTMSVSTDEPELVELVMPFFEAWRWQRPAEVELKIDARDGRAKVIEINPRLPSYVPFAISCGLHLPRLCARVALGETPDVARHAVGRTYVHPMLHLKAGWAEQRGFAAKVKALGRAIGEARPALRGCGSDLLDPAPCLGAILLRWTGEARQTGLQPGGRLHEVLQPTDDGC
jgi:hypothetical protein